MNHRSVRTMILRFKTTYKSNIEAFMAGPRRLGRTILPIGSPEIEKELLSEDCL